MGKPHSHTVPKENLATCTIYSKLVEISIKGKKTVLFLNDDLVTCGMDD